MDDVDQAIHNTKVAIGKLMAGDIPRELATAIFSGMHALSRLIELKRRLIEQDAVIARLDAIEAHQRAQGRGTAWHHRQRS